MQRVQNHASDQEQDALMWQTNIEYEAAEPAVYMHQIQLQLENSKKSRLMGSNSAKFNAVTNGIEKVIRVLDVSFTGTENDADPASILMVHKAYSELLHACKVYNNTIDSKGNATARKAFFSRGRNRQDIVSQIEEMAARDYAQLKQYFDKLPLIPLEERPQNVQGALKMARTRQLQLKGTWSGQKHLGGAVSDLAVINEGDLSNTSSSGLFKAEEIYTKKNDKQNVLDSLAKVQSKVKLDQTLYRKIVDEVTNHAKDDDSFSAITSRLKAWSEYTTSIPFHEFIDLVHKTADSHDTVRNIMRKNMQMNVESGEEINFSKLNVAAARVAKLFGAGNLIAQSEIAQLHDSEGNQINGFLMQKAEGIEGASFVEQVGRKDVEERQRQGLSLNSSSLDVLPSLKSMITPAFQKSLADLQVLDNLMGQMDRHDKNFLVQTDAQGRAVGLTGIDNDFAFGMNRLGLSTDDEGAEKEAFSEKALKFAIKYNGEFCLPHMSAGLADRIAAMKKEQVDYALADVLNPAQLKAFWGRVVQMQQAIAAERKKDPHSKRFLQDDEWNDETLEDFINTDHNSHNKSYLGTFMHSKDLAAINNDMRNEDLIKAVPFVWNDLHRQGKLNTPEDVAAFLKNDCKVPNDKITYLMGSGQIDEWCQDGKGVSYDKLKKAGNYIFTSYVTASHLLNNYPEIANKYLKDAYKRPINQKK